MSSPQLQPDDVAIDPEDLISDWYLPLESALDGFVYPNGRSIKKIEILHPIAQRLLEQCKEISPNAQKIEFFIKDVGGRLFRGHRMESISGTIFQLRRMPTHVPALSELGIPRAIQEIFLHEDLKKGGLILIAGETGQGKSTTCAAAIKARMEKFSSFCLTIENPPEAPLNGRHKNGRCIQTEVESGDFAAAMRGALRAYPTIPGNILYVGETRDAETASEVLKIAINGHLVFTTVHAGDIVSGIKRFASMASSRKDISEDGVKSILADGLRMVLHQRLDEALSKQGYIQKKLNLSFLLSHSGASSVAYMIRKSNLESLSSPIDNQRRTLEVQGVSGLMKIW